MKAERESKLHTYCLPDIKGTEFGGRAYVEAYPLGFT